jgi:hypothetical protein
MVAIMGALVALAVTNAAIFPVPLAANPMEVLSFVQVKVVPVTADPTNEIKLVEDPLHTTWLTGWVTAGVGFTAMVNVLGTPAQLTVPLV